MRIKPPTVQIAASLPIKAQPASQAFQKRTTTASPSQLDILTLEETTSNTVTVNPLVNFMNTLGYGTYATSTVQGGQNGGTTGGNGPSAVIYNSSTLQLIGSVGFTRSALQGRLGEIMRYEFQPLAYAPPEVLVNGVLTPVAGSAAFYVYVDHMKADSGTTNENRRNVEAQQIIANAQTLPAGSPHHLHRRLQLNRREHRTRLGNDVWRRQHCQRHTSIRFMELPHADPTRIIQRSPPNMSESTGSAVIPPAAYRHRNAYAARFDVQLGTSATTDGHGFSLINGSYHIFGNTSVGWGGQVTRAATPNGVGTVTVETFNSSGTLTSHRYVHHSECFGPF